MASRSRLLKKLVLALACSASLTAWAQVAQTRQVDVPAGDLPAALELLRKQVGGQIIYRADQMQGVRTRGVSGALSAEAALEELLEGTGWALRRDSSGAMVVVKAAAAPRAVPARPAPRAEASEAPVTDLGKLSVTGSRLTRTSVEGPVPVNIYTRQDIDRSGQGTLTDFLNTLPEVSVATPENYPAGGLGQTTVRLRGLPMGTTLVLLNGRRLETGGATAYYGGGFDLNNLPAAVVERVEVVPEGSSAIYGSDALAGVVNIILRKDFEGFQAGVRYGAASGVDESTADFAWGKAWERGSLSVSGSAFKRSTLGEMERRITSDETLGARVPRCNPGNVYSIDGSDLPGLGAPSAAVRPDGNGAASAAGFMPGQLNQCKQYDGRDSIPPAERGSLFVHGTYQVSPNVELFTELMHTRQKQDVLLNRRNLTRMRVPATNAFNPFGRDVLVDYRFSAPEVHTAYLAETEFTRILAGARGRLAQSWDWEIAAWDSRNLATTHQRATVTSAANLAAALASPDPATALNLFVPGRPASESVLKGIYGDQVSRNGGGVKVANAFVRGTPWVLPSGPIDLVVGGEYSETDLTWRSDTTASSTFSFQRTSKSLYSEARVPIVGSGTRSSGADVLAASLALRYDHYSDFGRHTTPQYALEWRPVDTLLLRAAYAKSFKAPNLVYLYGPVLSGEICCVTDPTRGGESVSYEWRRAGNPDLDPEYGKSRSVGLVWSPASLPDLAASLTWWQIGQRGFGTLLQPQAIVDNEALFPGRVTRDAQTGVIRAVDYSHVNFGAVDVSGMDLRLGYAWDTASLGTFRPSLGLTRTHKYEAAMTPASLSTNRVGAAESQAWAPRWKGVLALGWAAGPYSANVAGRYVSEYLDYQDLGPTTRLLGDFWLLDASARYDIGQGYRGEHRLLSKSFIQVGAVNLLNSLPEYSVFNYGLQTYDPSQYDIRGRFVYAHFGIGF